MSSGNFRMTRSIPFNRTIRVVGGKDLWSSLDLFEVRCQLRASRVAGSPLIADLHPFMEPSFEEGRTIGVVSLSDTTLTAPDGDFTTDDLGRWVRIPEAGVDGHPLFSEIITVVDSTTAFLKDKGSIRVSGVTAKITDDILVAWVMTGAEVATITASGVCDMVLSDIGGVDANAINIPLGHVTITSTTTEPATES